MFEYFYHEILRRTVISFGSLFNNISVKHADNSDNIVRSSCVGCGICSAVCPRGVLNLENADPSTRNI